MSLNPRSVNQYNVFLASPGDVAAERQYVRKFQWKKVRAFRQRMQDLNNPVFCTKYPGAAGCGEVFQRDLNLWLAGCTCRPAEWAAPRH